jgi:site-specific DNA-cytosine methylase
MRDSIPTNKERAHLQMLLTISFKGGALEMIAQIGEAVLLLLGQKIAETVEVVLKDGT